MTANSATAQTAPDMPRSQLLPLLASYDYEALKDDIARRGVLVPVLINEVTGEIIDGHHRAKIADELGIQYPVELVNIENLDEARIIAVGLNVKRRRLTLEQRSELAATLRKDGWTQQQIADALGINQSTIARWLNEAVEDATDMQMHNGCIPKANAKLSPEQKEEIYERVDSGETQTAIAADYGVTRQAVAKAVQSVINKRDKAAQALAQTQVDMTGSATIYLSDALDFLEGIEDESVDLLLTDPPYMTDVEDIDSFARSWVDAALAKIKPNGRAYICTGAYPTELQAYLALLNNREDFALANMLVWTYRNTLGPSPKLDYKLNWQAIFYLRGPEATDLSCPIMNEQFSVQDINAPDGRQGDRYHAWQKPLELAERLIRHSTTEGDTVIDPFACTGTFLLAAASLGRHGIGSEVDSENLQIAITRGCSIGDI